MNFKSQVGQDKWVCEFFNNKRGGYFLDIGAFDGVIFSNTHYLEKELGWTGICIEAGMMYYSQLVKNRSCECLHNAIYKDNIQVNFNENWTAGSINNSGNQVVNAITFERLLKGRQKLIDYISLDIEGFEYAALTKFPFKTHESILWTIEHNSHLDEGKQKEQIRNIMQTNGYNYYEGIQKPRSAGFEDWFINSKYDNN
jgi:FkbM family methyltransferase